MHALDLSNTHTHTRTCTHTHTRIYTHTCTCIHTHTYMYTHTHTRTRTHTRTPHTRHIGILYIKDCTFKMEAVPLATVRPFVIDSVTLAKTGIPPQEEDQVMGYLSEKV